MKTKQFENPGGVLVVMFVVGLAIVFAIGCEPPRRNVPPPPPKPTISIEQCEQSNSNSLKVTYLNHQEVLYDGKRVGNPYVVIETLEQLNLYKK